MAGAGNEFFKYFVFKDPTHDYVAQPINYDSHVALADRPDIQVINAVDPDIGKYVQRGGKLMMYKGWNDAGVPPGQPIDYYDRVVKRIGDKARTMPCGYTWSLGWACAVAETAQTHSTGLRRCERG